MNIILDMDETLLNGNFISNGLPFVQERPFLDAFFLYIFSRFENVSIWTHATTDWFCYCYDKVLKRFLPPGRNFFQVITRDNGKIPCRLNLEKNLEEFYKICPNHHKYNTFILDDNPLTYKNNIANSIPIKPYTSIITWFDNKNVYDSELLNIIQYLEKYLFC
jgi:hypothetical protein